MNVVLWILAGLLGLAFLAAGTMKVARPREALQAAGMDWVEDFPPSIVKLIGALEVLAAVGLVLPGATDIAPVLVPLAAVGLVLLMAGAALTHLRRHESQMTVINAALLALAVVVAWGRFGPYPFN